MERGGVLAAQARARLEGGPELPDTLAYLWRWFSELDAQRSAIAMVGPASLTYTDVRNWAVLTDRHPKPYEIEALMRLDGVVLMAMRPERKK